MENLFIFIVTSSKKELERTWQRWGIKP